MMRIKREIWLGLGITAFVLWVTLISIAVLDLYYTQGYLIDSLIVLQDSVRDIYDYIFNSFEGVWL